MALFKYKNKSSPNEYLPSMLPSTRRAMFFDILKLHYGKFIIFGLLVMLFSLPIHAAAILEDSNIMQITQAMQDATNEQKEAGYAMINGLKVLFSLVKVPFLIIFALFLSGLARIIRRYSWGENVLLLTDFTEGVKSNSISFVLLFLVGGLLNSGALYCKTLVKDSSFASQMLGSLPVMALAILVAPIFAYTAVIVTIYKTNILKALMTALVLYIKAPFKTALAMIICMLPFVIQIIPIVICHLIGRIIACFLTPIVFLGWYLFCLNQLDKYVNKQNYPTIVGKGLYKKQ